MLSGACPSPPLCPSSPLQRPLSPDGRIYGRPLSPDGASVLYGRSHSPDGASALLYQQLQQLQLYQARSQPSSPTHRHHRSSPPLLSAGITSGIPLSSSPAGGISSGLPLLGKHLSLSGSCIAGPAGGITWGLPVAQSQAQIDIQEGRRSSAPSLHGGGDNPHLCMIKEDRSNGWTAEGSRDEEDMAQENAALPRTHARLRQTLSAGSEAQRSMSSSDQSSLPSIVTGRTFSGNPHISITDDQGHVTEVISTDPGGEPMEGQGPGSFSEANSRLKLQQILQPGWINTHLASIAAQPPTTAGVSEHSGRAKRHYHSHMGKVSGPRRRHGNITSYQQLSHHSPSHSQPSDPYNPGISDPFNPVNSDPYNPVTSDPYNPLTSDPFNPVTSDPYNFPLGSSPQHSDTPNNISEIPTLNSQMDQHQYQQQHQLDQQNNFLPSSIHSPANSTHSCPPTFVYSQSNSPVSLISSSPIPPINLSSPSSPTFPSSQHQAYIGLSSSPSINNLSRPSSPLAPTVSSSLFPSVGHSPTSQSPGQVTPTPTPTNTPRTSICTLDWSGPSEPPGPSDMDHDHLPPFTQPDSSSVLLEIRTPQPKSMEEVLLAVKTALDSTIPQVDYQCQDTSFRLNHGADLSMELEVCSATDGHVPGLAVRKLSGDSLEYAKLCSHLMAVVNN